MADKKCFALLLKKNLKLPLPSHWSAAAAAVELAHNWTESKRSGEEMRCPKNNCQWKMRAAAEAIEAKEEKICKQRKELSNHQRNYCPFSLSFWSFAFTSTTHKFAPSKERGCNSLPVPIWQWWWWWWQSQSNKWRAPLRPHWPKLSEKLFAQHFLPFHHRGWHLRETRRHLRPSQWPPPQCWSPQHQPTNQLSQLSKPFNFAGSLSLFPKALSLS